MKRLTILTLLCALALFAMQIAHAEAREALSADGTWGFRLDPGNVGEAEAWFSDQVTFEDTIQVPGAWDAQGFGDETDKLHHNFIGKGWYKRDVTIPASWQGRHVFVCIGGVHRYAKVWVNGALLGEHIGYLSPFEYDITPHVIPGKSAAITICVDSEQRWDIDTLLGCFDIIDYMDTYWGGIWGHVTVEARSTPHMQDFFVEPRITPQGCDVRAALAGDPAGCDGVRVEVLDAEGSMVAQKDMPLDTAVKPEGLVSASVALPGAALWTPDSPVLYTARLSLLKDGAVIDHVESRFGLREIAIEGTHILLNGKRIFLHGYGDDCIYPETMAGPSDKAVYLKRLRIAKEYGFNHVRHHSHLLPPEYYDACDEVGMLVSAEFPIGYQSFYDRAKEPALELYRSEWAAVIKRFRNHPSIFDWCMGNEMWEGVPLAPEMYAIAKGLDTTRPVVDSDGLWAEAWVKGERDRDTLDLYFAMFDVFANPLDKPDKFDCPNPQKPVISHETGNYVTLPRLDLIDEFQHNFKPFWLTQTRDRLDQIGLLDEAELWAENSERLYLLLHKTNTESLRKEPNISGYHWWLFQDYWTTTNGIVDTYFRPKPGISQEAVKRFNADVVLLEDGLDLTYRAGDRVNLALLVSNYSADALSNGVLRWQVLDGESVIAGEEKQVSNVPQGEVVELAQADVPVPDTEVPRQLRVRSRLDVGGRQYVNEWTTWAYPAIRGIPDAKNPVFASAELLPTFAARGAMPLPDTSRLGTHAGYIGSYLTEPMLDAMTRGACVILVQPPVLFPSAVTRFKTAWWHGNASDNNAGTVAYGHFLVDAMAPEGWCDAGWFRLIENSHGYVLDDLPATPEVLVRGIEVWSVCRNKALLFEAKVGEGSLVVCGLNLDATVDETGIRAPEAEWLAERLVLYASTSPQPRVEFPVDFLRERVAEAPHFEGPFLEGFSRLIRNAGEEAAWFTYREARGTNYICRQTEKGHEVEWEIAPVPEGFHGEGVTFVFAGGLGWVSQPAVEGFALAVNGEDVLDFDVAQGFTTWRNDATGVVLFHVPKRTTNEDSAGLFYVRIPATMLEPGKPCRFAVRSKGEGSQRWFALHPYTDVLGAGAGGG
jgi:beta-galactosidase